MLNTIYDLDLVKNIIDENKVEEIKTTTEGKFHFGDRSVALLNKLHVDLQKVAYEVIKISPYDLTILPSTIRTIEEQIKFVATGKSKTYNSRHLYLTACDFSPLINGKITWEIKYYKEVCPLWQQCADKLGIKIRLGANFEGFPDFVHVELDKSIYKDDPAILANIQKVLKSKGLK